MKPSAGFKPFENALALPLATAIALCKAKAFAADLAGMKMHVFEEPNEDRALTVATSGAGGRKNLQMVVFDNGGAAPGPAARDETGGIPDGGDAVVMDGYPRRPAKEDDLEIETYGELGFRQDQLKFSIAAPSGRPNVLSELKWNNVQSLALTGGTKMTLGNWLAEGRLSYGQVFSGKNQDSDYFLDNREGEFSRSNNTSDDGMAINLSAGLGYTLKLLGDKRRFYWQMTPKVGYAYHSQTFNNTDGYQTIPALGGFAGLDSNYDAVFYGPWGGLWTKIGFAERLSFEAGAAYHWVDYEGTGEWNLRQDFQQPKSFSDEAEGGGITALAVARWVVWPDWILRFSAEYRHWIADNNGVSTTFFSDGSTVQTPFNEVKWKSYGVNLGFEYRF